MLIPFNKRLHIKFEEIWPRGFRGEAVQRCERTDRQTTDGGRRVITIAHPEALAQVSEQKSSSKQWKSKSRNSIYLKQWKYYRFRIHRKIYEYHWKQTKEMNFYLLFDNI